MCERGFTLIEILVALAASLIVLSALVGNFLLQHRSYEQQAQFVEMQENVRAGIEMMTRELLMAGYNPTGGADDTGIVLASHDSIRFKADLDRDGNISGDHEDITYALDTVDFQLTRNSQPLAENIPPGGLQFTYYDRDNIQLSSTPLGEGDLEKVRRITIQLRGRTKYPTPGYGYKTTTLTSYVVPRNLAYGLGGLATLTGPPPSGPTLQEVSDETPQESPEGTGGENPEERGEEPSRTALSNPGSGVEDMVGPQVLDITQDPSGDQVPKGVTVTVTARVNDSSGLDSVILNTNLDGSIVMLLITANTYAGVIPQHNNKRVSYFIAASDPLGNRTISGTMDYEQDL